MPNKIFMLQNVHSKNVEIMCKSLCKSLCSFVEKNCVQLSLYNNSCVKTYLFTHFSRLSHRPFHNLIISIIKLFYPLFHNPYNNNYIIFN